jgi:FkbM family methyltransferase
MSLSTTLTLTDDVRMVVPDSIHLITPYVLMEQRDWFEDEIKFLRRLLQTGQKVIDIGANYGVYTLSMARTVGPSGAVWAFEPASSTMALLAQGVAANGFSQVVLESSALSSSSGSARLSLSDQSEMNALVRSEESAAHSETVPLVTLDECMQKYGWRDIAFMKIDAEGEEANILKGGRRFFAELSPLIQYEVKAGAQLHLELITAFEDLGYDSYRLVPGLDVLIPFDTTSVPDGYLLNLFCCKVDRAEVLADTGFLLTSVAHGPMTAPSAWDPLPDAYDWRQTLVKLPYGTELAALWEQTMAQEAHAELEQALACYAISQDRSLTAEQRFEALDRSFRLLKTLCEGQPVSLRWASLARVAKDYGARAVAVAALDQLAQHLVEGKLINPGEPFLAPNSRFDSISILGQGTNWILASVLEEFEILSHYSSVYTGESARQRLEMIRDLGLGSDEMQRRLNLLHRRFGAG